MQEPCGAKNESATLPRELLMARHPAEEGKQSKSLPAASASNANDSVQAGE